MQDERKSQAILGVVFAMSASAHLAAWIGLGLLPSVSDTIAAITITDVALVEEEPPPEPPPPPEPEEEEPPPPEPPPEPVVRRERPTPTEAPPPDAPPPPDEPPPAAEEQIEDFTGETLTNESGEAWQSAVGTGAPMDAPIGAPTGVVTGRHRSGTEGGTIGGTGTGEPGPRLVAARDLSAPPGAPAQARLAELIQRFYPVELRRLAIEGTAVVRLRVSPDGAVSRVRVRSESHEGFGQACVQVLQEGGRWSPGPRDRDGNAVATEVNFECRFSVRL